MEPLAVTGLGVVSPLGIGRHAFRRALGDPSAAHDAAFAHSPTVFSHEEVPPGRVAEVWGFDPAEHLGKKGHRNFDRLTKMLIVAAKSGLGDAGLKKDGELDGVGADRIGICSATAYGSLDAITELNRVAELEDPRYINPTRFPNTVINAAAGYVSIWEGLRAPNATIVDGNCGALDAMLTCEAHLTHRRGDAFLVGGGEVLSEPLYLAFRKLGVLAESTDGLQDAMSVRGSGEGLHLGEAAAYATVERIDHAAERGATIHAHVIGYGTSFDPPASEALLVHASADGVERAIRSALEDAGVEVGEVDAVVSAEGGLAHIDGPEREGIARALGEEVAVAAPKRIFGETFGAGGALGLAVALAWLDGAPVAPLIAGRAPAKARTVVVSTVGFYGNATAVVVRHS